LASAPTDLVEASAGAITQFVMREFSVKLARHNEIFPTSEGQKRGCKVLTY